MSRPPHDQKEHHRTRQLTAITRLLLAKGIFTEDELRLAMDHSAPTGHQREREADELEIERETTAQLRAELGKDPDHYYAHLVLTPTESLLVAILRRLPAGCSRQRLRDRLGFASARGTVYSSQHLSVLLKRIDPKLAAEAIRIERRSGALFIGPEGQAKLTDLEVKAG